MELLTGAGLASAAGLNAWLPLLLLGSAARWTDVVALPDGWAWLSEPGVLAVLAVLLVVEVLADKVPGVDHVNDALQTVVRPLAGGVAASAGTGGATAGPGAGDDASWLAGVDWTTVLAGAAVALVVHLLKAAGRAAVNATTAGVGAPVASAAEDALSLGLVASALLAPVLVLVALAVLVAVAVAVVRRRRRRRAVRPV
ncbi:DUF4126 domain-containing protein [uncultured Pseudokineococcus sp.]|uniref:DUF4126 domain-containing protein n=1 Tax=uncultured Pseudokineococcus sp. TaxID=1642928 RepID=UPI00262DA438|nr:DUF4126 domain-containing protein [uncultured Pseudokineococcus sp.]